MKKIDEVIKRIEQITLEDGNQYHIEIRELIISKIEQYRNELLDELEKEIEHGKYNETGNPAKVYWVVSLDKIKQKFAEMREEKWKRL